MSLEDNIVYLTVLKSKVSQDHYNSLEQHKDLSTC